MRTLTYASRDGADLVLDLYLPASPVRRPAPVIVFLHGGGWAGGTRTTGPDFRRFFAQDGFAMASIEYRLTPSITFPANVEDVRTAVRWLKANAVVHGLDADRICLWGTSAGGHLAAVAGLAPRGTFEGTGNPDQTSAVRCVLDGYGPTRFDLMDAQTTQERPTLQKPGHAAACRRTAAHVLQSHRPRRGRGSVPDGCAGASSRRARTHARGTRRRLQRGAPVLPDAPAVIGPRSAARDQIAKSPVQAPFSRTGRRDPSRQMAVTDVRSSEIMQSRCTELSLQPAAVSSSRDMFVPPSSRST